jgi:2-iminobutanoate/2-iminopropanoate deaminase
VKQFRNPETIHQPLAGYSHQVEISGDERLLILAGQVGMQPDGRLPEEAADQLDVALTNVMRNLEAAGMAAQDLVKLIFYLVEEIEPARRGAVLGEHLAGHAPAMTLVYVAALATPAYKVEIDAWASS